MATSTIPFTVPNSDSGYMKLPCGALLQWGIISVTANNNAARYFSKKGTSTLTFPIAFSDTPTVLVTVMESGGWWETTCNAVSSTSINIHIAGDTSTTKNVFWFAVGEWSDE